MKIIKANVVYLDKWDLFKNSRLKKSEDITIIDIKEKDIVYNSDIAIYSNQGEKPKLLKTRY